MSRCAVERVLIIGACGAGKSTLSVALAEATGLPLIHLDQERWRPGWVKIPKAEWQARVVELIAARRWIIEGNYNSSLPLRLTRADTVIDLDLPTALCLWRVVKRWLRYRGRTRPDMHADCPERFDWAFMAYVARFRRDIRPKIERAMEGFGGIYLRLTSTGDVIALLQRAGAARG